MSGLSKKTTILLEYQQKKMTFKQQLAIHVIPFFDFVYEQITFDVLIETFKSQ